MSSGPMLVRSAGVLARRTLRGVLLSVSSSESEPILMTAPGDAVWDLLDRPRSQAELVDDLAAMFNASRQQIEADLGPVLAQLIELGALIEVEAGDPASGS